MCSQSVKRFSEGSAQRYYSYALLAVAIILMVGSVVMLYRRRREEWRGTWSQGWASLRLCAVRSGKDRKDAKVRELLTDWHLNFWRMIFKVGHCLSFLLLSIFLLRLFSKAWGPDFLSEVLMEVGQTLFFGMVWMMGFSMVFNTVPSLLTTGSLHVFLFLSQLGISRSMIMTLMEITADAGRGTVSAQLSVEAYSGVHYSVSGTLALSRLFLSVHASMPVVVLINTVNSVVIGYLRVSIAQEMGRPCGEVEIVQDELVTFIMLVLLCFGIRWMTVKMIHATLVAKASENAVSATETVLYGLCDAVVRLNEDLRLAKPSYELDTMLLNTSWGVPDTVERSFLGMLCTEADRSRFEAFVTDKAETHSKIPKTLHVSLKDTSNVPVPVQLFHTWCLDATDEVFHIIGIRESTDLSPEMAVSSKKASSATGTPETQIQQDSLGSVMPDPLLFSSAGSKLSAGSQMSRIDERDEREKEKGIGRISSETRSSVYSSQNGLIVPEAVQLASIHEYRASEISFWVDPVHPSLAIRKCTPEFFALLGGPSLTSGLSLLARSPSRDREGLMMRVQSILNQMAQAGREATSSMGKFHVRLLKHGLTTARGTMQAPAGVPPECLDLDVFMCCETPVPLVKFTCALRAKKQVAQAKSTVVQL